MSDLTGCTPLSEDLPHASFIQRMPAITDGRQLPDMGTMTARLSWEERRGSSPIRLPAPLLPPASISLIETAKANRVEPYAYLKHVFGALPAAVAAEDDDAITRLLPWNVATANA